MRRFKIVIGFAVVATLAVPAAALAQDEAIEAAKAEAELARELALAQEAAEKARKAYFEALEAATSAAFGPLSDVAREGTVDAANAGKLETQLLAADAMRQAASTVVARLAERGRPLAEACAAARAARDLQRLDELVCDRTLVVMTEGEKQNFESYEAFKVQIASIEAGLDAAIALASQPAAPGGTDTSTAALGLTALSTALSVVGNLARSDYKVASIDLSATTDALFAKAVVEQGISSLPYTVQLANMMIRPFGIANEARTLLGGAAAKRSSLAAAADQLRGDKTQASTLAKMDAAIKAFDDFRTRLSTPDSNGQVPFVAIERQADIERRLGDGSMILFLKADFSGGSTYTQKNFFTFFGGIPFFVSGGALTSFTLVDGKTGSLLDAGVIDNVTPFRRINAIRGRP